MPTKKSTPSGVDSAATRPSRVKPKAEKPAVVETRVEGTENPALADLTAVYGLYRPSGEEQRLVDALVAERGAASVQRLAAVLNQSLGAVLSLLGPQQLLRQAAIIEVEPSSELGFPRPSEQIFLGRGLLAASPKSEVPVSMLPGLAVLAAPATDGNWAAEFVADRAGQVVLELVKEKLVSTRPLLLFLSSCGADTTGLLAQAVRLRLSRPVFYLEGGGLTGWPQPELAAALRRLRRDADLRGAAVVVQDAEQLGSAWRALLQPKPPGQTAPVILCSGGTLSAPKYPQTWTFGNPLQPHAHTLRFAAATASAPTGSTTQQAAASPEPELSEIDRSREEARRQAAVDAAKAMGKPIPKELLQPVQTTPPPSTVAAPASISPPSVTATAPASVAAKTEAASPPAARAEPSQAQVAAPAARPVNPRLAAALAKAGLPPVSRTDPAAAAAPVTEAVVAKPAPAAIPTPTATPTPAAAPAPAPEPVSPASSPVGSTSNDGDEEGPPIPLADDAKLEDLINAAKTTTNMRQRAELLRRLAGTKSPNVIQLFRLFCVSPHAAVRQAAEEGMASLFGSNWNRARSIAPPVQPPRTDDGGRGPGGAF